MTEAIIVHMLTFDADDPPEVARLLAGRVRSRRLEANLTQQAMAGRAGMSLSTYRRFESTGAISLQHLILVAVALGATGDFDALFATRQYASIDEVITGRGPSRQRGRRRD